MWDALIINNDKYYKRYITLSIGYFHIPQFSALQYHSFGQFPILISKVPTVLQF